MGEYEKYKKEGDEYYNLFLKTGTTTKVNRDFLDEAKENYKKALVYADTPLEKERVKRQLKEVKNALRIFGGPFKKLRKISKGKSLEKKMSLIVFAFVSFIFSLFFLSPNITGNVIGNLKDNNSNILGVFLFLSSLGFAFFYFRKRK